ncbi:type II toxin-antitoxin system antitoxin DNA ADP-ribosyl glycohydrolase DarG [Actinophytocola oryzae]|uniref:O-acetyl-ADP-ribose deacetylase (Regulator of RNase III) n=1 Tax=Actinophytocola oryzae TaxID=502181 RepID=A0A4V6Q6I9_9PSEU|nr:macro domain-containing protein [Actinophytocola oryzae]TDV40741.1 O-acetyl-ADP-ribose deacetylase (regulator of RNase III) [Actinophytocola oryzae]
MITETRGDLLNADAEALVNTVNCVGVMGKGIALQFKRRYPENFKLYAKACTAGEVKLGEMFVVELHTITSPRYIINFPTKNHWRSKSRLDDIDHGLDDLIRVIREREIRSIAIPPLGAGNGGLAWDDVSKLIYRKLAQVSDVAIQLFAPSGAKRALAPQALRMSWGRATIIKLIEAYAEYRRAVEPWEPALGASHLEIQKLSYFANIVMPHLNLRFEAGQYGPYSEQTRHLIQEMEGSYLEGHGDGTSRVQELIPIIPTDTGSREADDYVHKNSSNRNVKTEIVDPVMKIIEGYEGPYNMELLASTHWLASHGKARNATEAWEQIQAWTARKKRLFTRNHVERAWQKLESINMT